MLSIVMPCYNCEKYLDKSIGSIISQTNQNYELILVDDGSKDNTFDICLRYEKEYLNIKAIHQDNKGLVGAWKAGVNNASGDYIAFCDSDDYLNPDFVDKISRECEQEYDLITFGMLLEYDDGKRNLVDNRIHPGYYDKKSIAIEILPNLFCNGKMQSEAILKSRCSKVFKKELLVHVMDDISCNLTIGEDGATTFASVLNADSLFCMDKYYPYHYVRNSASMIGDYDCNAFKKLEVLNNEYQVIAKKNGYLYDNQIKQEYLSTAFIFMKKEITRNPAGISDIANKLKEVRESDVFETSMHGGSVSGYSLASRVFAELIIRKKYYLATVLVRLISSKGK